MREWAHAGKLPYLDAQGPLRFNRQAILEWALARGHPLNLGEEQRNRPGCRRSRSFSRRTVSTTTWRATRLRRCCARRSTFFVAPEADKELIYDLLVSREKLMTTALGEGLAVPHLRVPVVVNVPSPALGIFFTRKPIDMGALDGKPVQRCFYCSASRPSSTSNCSRGWPSFSAKPEFVELLRSGPRRRPFASGFSASCQTARNSK